MKSEVSVKKIIMLIILTVGIHMMIDGIICRHNISSAGLLQDIEISKLKDRQYFVGNIKYLAGIQSKMEGEEKIYPIISQNAWTGDEYYLACINDEENNYICIEVPKKYLRDFENSLNNSLESSYYFECKVLKESTYNHLILESYNDCYDKKINYNEKYILKIVDYGFEQKRILKGAVIFGCGFVCMIVLFLMTEYNTYEAADGAEKLSVKTEYIIESELVKIIYLEKKKNAVMKARYRYLKNKVLFSIVVMLLLFSAYFLTYSKMLLYVVSFFMALFILSISELTINSNNKIAGFFSRKKYAYILEKQIQDSDELLSVYYSKLDKLKNNEDNEG